MKKLILLLLFIPLFSFSQELLLFSDDNKFLGCLNCSEYSSESICNKYGTYGSKYNSESIWNQYGTYGSKYNSESPWNEYSSSGPKIVDKDGNYYGRFSINTYSGYSNSDNLKKIYEYFDGDLEKIRDSFCE